MPYLFTPGCPCCDPCPAPDCDEGDCIDYGEIVDCPFSANAPRRYLIDFGASPCFDCCANASGEQTVCWDSGCTWKSIAFTCGSDTYQWVLVVGSTSTLSLTRTAGSGTLISVEYTRTDAWDGLCKNAMGLDSSDNCDDARSGVCAEPQLDTENCLTCSNAEMPLCWEVVLAGFSDALTAAKGSLCTSCDCFNGTFPIEMHQLFSGLTLIGCTGTYNDGCVKIILTFSVSTVTVQVSKPGAPACGGSWAWSRTSPSSCSAPITLTYFSRLDNVCWPPVDAFFRPDPITIQPLDCPSSVAANCP